MLLLTECFKNFVHAAKADYNFKLRNPYTYSMIRYHHPKQQNSLKLIKLLSLGTFLLFSCLSNLQDILSPTAPPDNTPP